MPDFLKKKEKRPVISLPLTSMDYLLITGTVIINAALWWYILDIYSSLNAEVPTHYNFNGQVDKTGAKSTIFLLPAISLATNILLYALSFFPHTFNYTVKITEQNAPNQYRLGMNLVRWTGFIISILFAAITYMTIQNAQGKMGGIGKWFIIIFMVITTVMMIVYFIMAEKKK